MLEKHELLSTILSKAGWRARSVCEDWQRRYDGGEPRPAPSACEKALRDGSWSDDLCRPQVAKLLRVSFDVVHDLVRATLGVPINLHHGCTPEELEHFRRTIWGRIDVPSTMILTFFQQLDGIDVLCRRILLQKEANRKAAVVDRPFFLGRGLQVLQLPVQNSGGTVDARHAAGAILRLALRERWVREYGPEGLDTATSDWVLLERKGAVRQAGKEPHPEGASWMLPILTLPDGCVPWLPGETTARALNRAETAADPYLLRRNRQTSAAWRAAAAASVRRSSFFGLVAERFGKEPLPPMRLWEFSAAAAQYLEYQPLDSVPSATARDAARADIDTIFRFVEEMATNGLVRWVPGAVLPPIDTRTQSLTSAISEAALQWPRCACRRDDSLLFINIHLGPQPPPAPAPPTLDDTGLTSSPGDMFFAPSRWECECAHCVQLTCGL